MLKSYFHNDKFKNHSKKIFTQSLKITTIKRAVDINILLNRVRLEERNELKKKIILFSFTTFTLILFGTLIAIIK